MFLRLVVEAKNSRAGDGDDLVLKLLTLVVVPGVPDAPAEGDPDVVVVGLDTEQVTGDLAAVREWNSNAAGRGVTRSSAMS